MKDKIKEYWVFVLIIILVIVSVISNESNSNFIKANIIMKDKGLSIMRYENVEIFQNDSTRLAFTWNNSIVVIIKSNDNMKIDIEEIVDEE